MTEKITIVKHYITVIRDYAISDCAAEIGFSRQALNELCRGNGCGRRMANAVVNWSGGRLSYELVFDRRLYSARQINNMLKKVDQVKNGNSRAEAA